MKLIVGLGNVGEQYQGTPHNMGFMVLDRLAAGWEMDNKLRAEVWRGEVAGQEVLLAKPTTMMNLSGEAVSRLAQFYKIAAEDIWIVHDELDLPLGRLKISFSGNDNGHNGLISISQRLGHQRFARFRVGVDVRVDQVIPGLNFVLMKYKKEDQDLLNRSVDMTVMAIKEALAGGIEVAQERYNGRRLEVGGER